MVCSKNRWDAFWLSELPVPPQWLCTDHRQRLAVAMSIGYGSKIDKTPNYKTDSEKTKHN